jgi:hypothetical protein
MLVAPAYSQAAPGTNIGNAQELSGSASGSLPTAQSDDWYVVYPASPAEKLTISVTNMTRERGPCQYLVGGLSNSEGMIRAEDLPIAESETHNFTESGSDRYFVELGDQGCDPGTHEAVHYKVQVTSGSLGSSLKGTSVQAAPGGSIGEAGEPLTGHVAYEGSISGSSNQWLVFDVRGASPHATVRVENTTVRNDSCQYLNLSATNTVGSVITGTDVPVEEDSAYTFTVNEAGRYFIHLANNLPEACTPPTGGPSTYQLQIDPASSLEQPPNPPRQPIQGGASKSSAAGPLGSGVDYYSTIGPSPGDYYYSVDVARPGPERFDVENIAPSSTRCQWIYVYLYGPQGNVISVVPIDEDTGYTFTVSEVGTYYLSITDDGCEKLEGGPPTLAQISISPAEGSGSGPPPVTPPSCLQVDFNDNEAVDIDHQLNGGHEPAIKITEFAGNDEVEWKCNPRTGEVVKNWPVVYVRGQVMRLEARFSVSAATRTFLETELEGGVTITGATSVGGTAIEFETKPQTLSPAEVKAQLAQHPEYLSTGAMWASASLPQKVAAYTIGGKPMEISWEWEVKQKGATPPIKQKLGTTVHNVYLTYEPSRLPAPGTAESEEKYFSLLDVDTRGLEATGGKPVNAAQAIAGVWKGFSTRASTGEPTVRLRSYDPATGAISREGEVMRYYSELLPGQTVASFPASLNRACTSWATSTLLQSGEGRCGAWARALRNALGTEGIEAEPVQIFVGFKQAGGPCLVPNVCTMLVKNWAFSKGEPSVDPTFPYKASNATDLEGLSGQGIENPIALFWDHVLVKAGGALYDPSYGTGPFRGGSKPTLTSVLTEYQKRSIAGFCRPEKEVAEQNQVRCQRAPEKLELVTEGPLKFP